MTRGGWTVSRRGYDLIKWSGAECAECALPVEIVHLSADPLLDDGTRVPIVRKVLNVKGQPGQIAARIVSGKMIGHRITKTRGAAPGYCVFDTHLSVCPEAPPPPFEQHSLFEPTEGDAAP
jgi:hypothetical protein